MSGLTFEIPLKTTSPENGSHGNWRAHAGKARHQRQLTALCVPWYLKDIANRGRTDAVFRVHLVRVASSRSRGLDPEDNLPGSFKHIRDQIAAELGFGKEDRHKRLKWTYDQRTDKGFWVEVQIEVVE